MNTEDKGFLNESHTHTEDKTKEKMWLCWGKMRHKLFKRTGRVLRSKDKMNSKGKEEMPLENGGNMIYSCLVRPSTRC